MLKNSLVKREARKEDAMKITTVPEIAPLLSTIKMR